MKLSDLTKYHEIICRSEQEWERIAKLLHKSGRSWGSGDRYWPLLYEWDENPMSYCLDGTYNDDEKDFSDLVVESTDIDDEAEILEHLKEDFFFRIGDKCWSPAYGHGEVVGMGKLLNVKFGEKDGVTWHWHYQADGREHPESPQPTLFHQEVTDWPCPARPFDLPKLNVDDKVYVDFGGSWEARHFSHWVVDNRIYMAVFAEGRTSHTSGGDTHFYTTWRIED